jgi:hypothetical protein
VRSLAIEPRPGAWVQHFRLDPVPAARDGHPIGLMRYVAGPSDDGGLRADLELEFLADGVRVLHSEYASPSLRRLVFREVRERAGRTLFLEGSPGQSLAGHELGEAGVERRALPWSELPLLLIESARNGLALPQEGDVVDPLSATTEHLKLAVIDDGSGRSCEARRLDGSLRWRVRLSAGELVEWSFQDGGPRARAIPGEEHERLRAQHDARVRAAREAAAEARPRSMPR